MFLSKEKSGIYYVYYNNSSGKRTKKSTGSKYKKDALKFLTEFSKKVEQEESQKTVSIRLNDFVWEFLKYSESVHSWNTTKTFITTFNYIKEYFGNVYLSELTEKALRKYFEDRVRTTSIYQARKDHINLSSLFTKAVYEGYLKSNPVKKIKKPKLPEKQPVYFSKEEFQLLINTIKEQDIKDLVIFAANTGLRQMELLSLQWEQVSIKERTLILDNRNHLTKSKRVRSVPLNLTALQILNDREGKYESNYVFTLYGEQMTQDSISNRFNRITKKAKLRKGLNFHSLRHTFASWLVQTGTPIFTIQKLLGHSDIKTTEIYAHLETSNLADAVNNL